VGYIVADLHFNLVRALLPCGTNCSTDHAIDLGERGHAFTLNPRLMECNMAMRGNGQTFAD
jgi:hypothetical protein